MKHMQKNRFNRYVGSGPASSVDCPDFIKVANAFGIRSKEIHSANEVDSGLSWLFESIGDSAILVVHLDPMQALTPRVQTESDENGRLMPGSLGSMYPFLDEITKEKVRKIFVN